MISPLHKEKLYLIYNKISHDFLRTKLSIVDLVAVAVLLDSEIFSQFVEHGGRDWCLEIETIWHVASQTSTLNLRT